MAVKHAFTSAVADGGDATLVQPSNWNANHTVDDNTFVAAKLSAAATDILFGRSTAGAGAGEEISCTSAGRAILDDASASAQRTTLGLVIGTDVQAFDAGLLDIAGLAVTDGNVIVGNGTNWVAESGATARTSLGLGTGDSPQFTGIELGHASDTTLTRSSAGNMAIEGNVVYRAGGTDVAIADGGTGASTAADARENLGLAFGAAPSDSDFAINVGTPGTDLFSETMTLAAGDTVELECEFAILNNSGTTRTYTFRTEVGATGVDLLMGTTIAASATNRTPFIYKAVFSIVSTSSVRVLVNSLGGTAAALGAANTVSAALTRFLYNTSASDLTGSQAIAFSIFSDNTTATQTAELVAYRVRKIPTV